MFYFTQVDSGLVDCNRSDTIVELMSVNQTKARELTEDWLERWRSSSETLENRVRQNSIQCSDVGVQTQPNVDNAADLIPVKQARQTGCWRSEDYDSSDALMSTYKVNDLANCASSSEWSQDSLDETTVMKSGQLAIRRGLQKEIVNLEPSDGEEEENDNISFQMQRTIVVRSPTPPLKNQRIHSRKVPSPKPHVRTIFSNTEGQQVTSEQRIMTALPNSTPSIVVDPPSLPSKEFLDHKATPLVQSELPDAKALLIRLNSLVGKLTMSDATSQNGHNWQPHRKPDSVFPPQTSFVMTPITTACCSVHHHCLVHHRPVLCHRHRCPTHQTPGVNFNIDQLLKLELLQIRRRIVARTASPKVVNRLSYLLPSNIQQDKTVEIQNANDNLPGEIWV